MLNFDAWITVFQEISAFMCNGAWDQFIFQTNAHEKSYQEVWFIRPPLLQRWLNYQFMLLYEWNVSDRLLQFYFCQEKWFPLTPLNSLLHHKHTLYCTQCCWLNSTQAITQQQFSCMFSRCSLCLHSLTSIKILHSQANIPSPQLEKLHARRASVDSLLSPKLPCSNSISPELWRTIFDHFSFASS